MIMPFAKIYMWGDAAQFLTAIILGFGFGFFLEQAGFGSAKKIAGVWYGYDFAVIRVMFTAIIVSLFGLALFHYLGILNFEMVYINPTYVLPQIVGGFIFGIGFNVGEYCPGTSAVSCATGKIDGIIYLLGFVVGVIVFSAIYPLIAGFAESTNMGRVVLSDVIPVPAGMLIFAIALISIGAFALTHHLDKKFGNT